MVSIVGIKHTIMSSCLPFINVLISCTAYPFVIHLKRQYHAHIHRQLILINLPNLSVDCERKLGVQWRNPPIYSTYIGLTLLLAGLAPHHHVLNGNNWGRPDQNVFHVLLSKPDTRSPATVKHTILFDEPECYLLEWTNQISLRQDMFSVCACASLL